MGADIHIFCERRNPKTKKWEKVGDHFSQDEFDKKWSKKEKTDHPFNWRSYGMFGFFADVRNYSHVPPISDTKGLPDDSEYLNEVQPDTDPDSGQPFTRKDYMQSDYSDYHSHSWLTLKELADFDYDKTFEDRRVGRQIGPNVFSGAEEAEPGEGQQITFREFLGSWYFKHLEEMKELGPPEDVRIVFWFDN